MKELQYRIPVCDTSSLNILNPAKAKVMHFHAHNFLEVPSLLAKGFSLENITSVDLKNPGYAKLCWHKLAKEQGIHNPKRLKIHTGRLEDLADEWERSKEQQDVLLLDLTNCVSEKFIKLMVSLFFRKYPIISEQAVITINVARYHDCMGQPVIPKGLQSRYFNKDCWKQILASYIMGITCNKVPYILEVQNYNNPNNHINPSKRRATPMGWCTFKLTKEYSEGGRVTQDQHDYIIDLFNRIGATDRFRKPPRV